MEMTPDLQTSKAKSQPQTIGIRFLRYWIGSFNGIQVFIFPVLLLNWLEALELVHVVTELLTFKIHYLPLTIFMFLAVYVLFIIAKYYVSAPHTKAEFKHFIIEFHKYLLICLLCFAILFLLAIFLKYFYGILISEKPSLPWQPAAWESSPSYIVTSATAGRNPGKSWGTPTPMPMPA